MNETLTPAPIDWLAMSPILAVFGTGVVAMLLEMFWPKRANNAIVIVSVIGLAVAAIQTTVRPGTLRWQPR